MANIEVADFCACFVGESGVLVHNKEGDIMRITMVELQCEDIIWFAVDKHNHIFACASAGEGNVPEFVCKSREQTDLLETFFFHELEASTEEKCLICIDKSNPLIQDFMLLSQKGLFCFDSYIDDTKQRYYKKYTAPVKPLFLDDLPHNIQHMLLGNRTDADVEIDTLITVPHAY